MDKLQDLELISLPSKFIFVIYLESIWWEAFLQAAGQPDEPKVFTDLEFAH